MKNVLVWSALMSAACSPERFLAIDAEPGDWVISMGVGSEGVDGLALQEYQESAFRIEIDEGQTPLAFLIHPPTEVRAMAPRALEGVTAVLEDPAGSCGCPVQLPSGPVYAFEGGSCPLPASVRSFDGGVSPETVVNVRSSLRLSFGGTCRSDCVPDVASRPLQFSLESAPESRPFGSVLTNANGTRASFSFTYRQAINGSNQQTFPSDPADGEPYAGCSMGDRFAVLRRNAERHESWLDVFSPDLATFQRVESVTGANFVSPLDDGRIILGGWNGEGIQARVLRLCEGEPAACHDLTPQSDRAIKYYDAVQLESGQVVLAAEDDGFEFIERIPPAADIRTVDASGLLTSDGTRIARWRSGAAGGSLTRVSALGNRVFGCGPNRHSGDMVIATAVLSAPDAPSDLEDLILLPSLSECSGFLPISPTEMAVFVFDEVLVFDASGTLTRRTSPDQIIPGIGLQAALQKGVRNPTLAAGSWGIIHTRHNGDWERISTPFRKYDHLISLPSGLWFVNETAENLLTRTEGTGFGRPVAATTADGEFVVGSTYEGSIYRLHPATGELQTLGTLPRIAPSGPFWSDTPQQVLARLGPESLIIAESVGKDLSIYQIRDGSIDLVWQQTFKTVIRVLDASAATEGVAFLSVLADELSALIRVVPTDRAPTVELRELPFETIVSAQSACPDSVVLATSNGDTAAAELRTWTSDHRRDLTHARIWNGIPHLSMAAGELYLARPGSSSTIFGVNQAESTMDGRIRASLPTEDGLFVATDNGALWRGHRL